ncbi:hypothetical protein Aduo_016775 [Ancylostoma duodenale]
MPYSIGLLCHLLLLFPLCQKSICALCCESENRTIVGSYFPTVIKKGDEKPRLGEQYCGLTMDKKCGVKLHLDSSAERGCWIVPEQGTVMKCSCGTHMCTSFVAEIMSLAGNYSRIFEKGGGFAFEECFEKLAARERQHGEPYIFPESEGCADTGMWIERNGYSVTIVQHPLTGEPVPILNSTNPRIQQHLPVTIFSHIKSVRIYNFRILSPDSQ